MINHLPLFDTNKGVTLLSLEPNLGRSAAFWLCNCRLMNVGDAALESKSGNSKRRARKMA
jgi:hypothetical protein